LKGKVKEKIGRATNDPDLEAEGQGENFVGKVQKKIGQVEKVLGKQCRQLSVVQIPAQARPRR
jgi:uncharacterized protein YjbJ (UPF0337 family)